MDAPPAQEPARKRGSAREDQSKPRRPYQSHRGAIAAALFVILGLIVGTALYFHERWRDHTQELARETLDQRAEVAAGQLTSLMASSLPQLSQSIEVASQAGDFGPEELEAATGGTDSAWVLDRAGRVLLSSPQAQGAPRQTERAAIRRGQTEISGLGEGQAGESVVRIAAPVGRADPIAGVVVAFPLDLAQSFIGSTIERIRTTDQSHAAVFDSDGALLASSGDHSSDLVELGPAVTGASRGEISHHGDSLVFASAKVSGAPWTVALATPRSELESGGTSAWVGLAAILGFALTGLAGIFLLLRVLRSAEEMERVNEELVLRTREAEQATHTKNDFISSMAHELRTPLAAIRMFTDLLRNDEQAPPSESQARALEDIAASTKHILDLLDDTMDIARVESGQLPLNPERVSPAALAIGVVDGLNPLADERGIDLRLEADGSIGEVFLDPARLRQVLLNLLSNALKFTRPGGRVVLRLSRHGPSSFAVSVEDTGIGIDTERIGELFSSMKRIGSPVHEQDSSRGLGLALTKRIVEAMGGHIGVESTPGEGSTFYAVLPRVNAERRAAVDPTSVAAASSVLRDPAPARDAGDRQFSALGIRSAALPGQNFGLGTTAGSDPARRERRRARAEGAERTE